MATRLIPCPSCHCHVKLGGSQCPFCEAPLPTEVAPRANVAVPGKALTRAAILFAGASAVGACSSSPSPVTFYGPAPIQGDAGGADAGEGNDAGHAQKDAATSADAGHTQKDAGVRTDAGHAQKDAESDVIDSGSPAVLYGPAQGH